MALTAYNNWWHPAANCKVRASQKVDDLQPLGSSCWSIVNDVYADCE
jgi:hypothetical protein